MLFRGEPVWVRVGDDGRMALDSDGRAEMKYRQEDTKIYRPSPSNLAPHSGGGRADETREAPSKQSRARKPSTAGAVPTRDNGAVEIWTDGACSGNPGPMGIGVVVIAHDKRHEHGEYLGMGTNNIAELVAIQRGLEIAHDLAPDPQQSVRVYTDSGYSIGVLSQGWKAKANLELIAGLRRMLARRPGVRLVKVAGHAGIEENERCDELARQAIAKRGPV